MAAALGIVVVSALWWLYFDVAAIFARRRLIQATGLELHRLALHAYSYLHLPMVAGVVLFALGLKTTVGHVGETLDTVPAVALCGGAALYLLAHIAFLFRTTGRVSWSRAQHIEGQEVVGSIGDYEIAESPTEQDALVAGGRA